MTGGIRDSLVDRRRRRVVVVATATIATAIITTVAGCAAVSTAGSAVRGSDLATGISARPSPGITTGSARPTQTPAASTTQSPAGTGADKFADLVREVVAAHADLASVTKSTRNRDPYSVDHYTSVQRASGGRVLQQVTFRPTTSAIFGITEIRCLGDLNFITPIPSDIDVQADDAHPWVSAAAEPSEDAPDSEHLAAYFCDAGYPTGLGYDVEFLLSATTVDVTGTVEYQGEQLENLVAQVPVDDAYLIPGLGWVGDVSVPDDDAPTVQVELLIGSDNLVRQLISKVQVDGRELGVQVDYSDFNQDVTIDPPDPAQVAQR
jgi:hypothetical protein